MGHFRFIYENKTKKSNNYRGICVTPYVGRLHGKIIKERMKEQMRTPEEQNDFRRGCSCTDNIIFMKQLIEKTIAFNAKMHIIFEYLRKANDSVPLLKTVSSR